MKPNFTASHATRAATVAIAVAATLLLSACGEKPAAKDDHGPGPAATADSHAGHAGADQKVTHYSDKTELFLEFPPLVAGQAATFAAHLTRLADFRAVTKGRLTVVLSGGNAAEERFVVDAPAVPGIFKPVVTPQTAGTREMALLLEADEGAIAHELGAVTIFPDAKAAQARQGAAEDSGIPFTKEQQWKIDFATFEATKGVARASIAATGTVKAHPDGEALIVAPSAGMLRPATSFPRVGQAVKKGQVLAMFAPRLGGDTDQATLEASAAKARVAHEQAQRERERMEALFKDEAVAEKRLIDARGFERIASAELDAAEQRARQSGGVGGIALRAPIDGIVANVSAAPGAFVAEGALLLHIAKPGRLWLEARVPESAVGRLGQPVGAAFTVEGFDRTFVIEAGKNGKLVAVGGVVDAASRTVPVVFEFVSPEVSLPIGVTARVHIFSGGSQEAVLIPAGAVQDESGMAVVYVQTGGESFARHVVRTGPRDGERIAILDGVEAGQRVVSKGSYLIRLSTSKAGPSGHAH
ncbi:MAG: efflux RND transporter periplasmic adaptor subunit [Sulfurisoma sp.]|nr:efflux RND transporter periplasmic adaptor subunit [Sulfurisoma sp.]